MFDYSPDEQKAMITALRAAPNSRYGNLASGLGTGMMLGQGIKKNWLTPDYAAGAGAGATGPFGVRAPEGTTGLGMGPFSGYGGAAASPAANTWNRLQGWGQQGWGALKGLFGGG